MMRKSESTTGLKGKVGSTLYLLMMLTLAVVAVYLGCRAIMLS